MSGKRMGRALAQLTAGAVGVVLLALVITVPIDAGAQLALGAAVFLVSLLIARFTHPLATLTLTLISVATSARYMHWRLTVITASASSSRIDLALGGVLVAAELYAFTMLLLGYLQSVPLRRRPVPLPEDTSRWPSVDVYIPTYNEPLKVVRGTVLAAKAMDWPADKLHIYLLDDGRRPAFRAFAEAAGVGYIVRPDNRHAKAGNLNHALQQTRGEFVAIFDCDHVPTRAFLQLCLGWMVGDPKLAVIQTPHHFYSPDPFERNLGSFRNTPNEGELFYGLIQPSNDLWNAAFFCGSCAVIRRSALEEVGGIAVETVTEDAHTALKLHRRGWRSAYLDLPLAAGLATESLSAHIGQRIRWARGMAQIFRIDNPFLGRGLSLVQRCCYAASMLHFFSGLPRIVFLLAPLGFLVFDRQIFNALPIVVAAFAVPHLAQLILANARNQGGVRQAFWSEVYETCLAFYILLPTTLALLHPKAGRFNVTAKGGRIEEPFFQAKMARPYLVVLALNLVALGMGAWKLWTGAAPFDVLLINGVWTAWNLLVVAATVAVAWERRQVRENPRVAVELPAVLRSFTGNTFRCETRDLSLGGACVELASEQPWVKGQRAWLSLTMGEVEQPLPVRIVSSAGRSLRVRFEQLALEEESALVRALFSRANAWTSWKAARPAPSTVRSFVLLMRHALGGLVATARGARGAFPTAPVAAGPASVGATDAGVSPSPPLDPPAPGQPAPSLTPRASDAEAPPKSGAGLRGAA